MGYKRARLANPTQHAPYSQQVVSQVELNDVDDEVAEEEDAPPMPPREEEDGPPPLPEVEPEAELEEEAVEIQKGSTKQSTPIVRPKRTRAVATPTQEETAQPSKKKTPQTKSKLTAKQVSTTKKAQSRPPKRVEELVAALVAQPPRHAPLQERRQLARRHRLRKVPLRLDPSRLRSCRGRRCCL